MKETFIVQIVIEENSPNHYGDKIISFKRVDSFPERKFSTSGSSATVACFDFGDMSRKTTPPEQITEKEIENELKYTVVAQDFYCVNSTTFFLEFDQDSYGKFIFITKMDKGAYLSVE